MKAAAPFVLAALVLLQAGLFVANSSGTYDETVYWRMAEAALMQRDNAEFSVKGVAPLPVSIAYSLPVLNHVSDYAPAILLARACAVALVAVPLVLVVYCWTASRYGTPAGAVAAALTAMSPNVVAHASIATTDACFVLFALLTLWALSRYVAQPTWGRLGALILAGGLVFAAKYSGVAIFAVAAVICAWKDRPQRPFGLRVATALAIAAAMAAAGMLFTWNYHPIAGFQSQISHQQLGHEAFLLGRRSMKGWWYYQPVALAAKSTYVELAALLLAVAAYVTRARTCTAVAIWGAAFAVVLALSMASHVNIGVRYVLVLVPLSFMGATAWMMRPSARRIPVAILAASALAVQAATAAAASPRPLSYFNGLAGGPMNGYRLLADSNLDWGQDLPAMRQVLTSVGAREALAVYFGSAPPDAYGVSVRLWELAAPSEKVRSDWIVISATYLDGLYLQHDPFEAFRSIEPNARPTPTLFVYDASRPDVKAALTQAMARKP